jgi:hypothetical protein
MRSYGQYRPIAQASALLAERWSIIIPRNIMVGCQTFTDDRYPAKGPPCADPVTPGSRHVRTPGQGIGFILRVVDVETAVVVVGSLRGWVTTSRA